MARLGALLAVILFAACTASTTTTTTVAVTLPDTTQGSTTTTSEPTTTTVAEPTPVDIPGTEGLPLEVRTELARLIDLTESLRQLQFEELPRVVVVSEQDLVDRVRTQIEEESEDFPADEALYDLLGLLSPEVDLTTLLLDLYGEQVAGFYDGEARELVVPMTSTMFSQMEKATLVHELVHALTDQRFAFDATLQAMVDADRLDEASAYQALVEGDATLVELFYLQGLEREELQDFFDEAIDIDTSKLDAAPRFIRDSLFFPYDSGLAFAQDLHGRGGWPAINDAYLLLPALPGSTEQVITPGDYRRDLPVEVGLPAVTLSGYELERESVWGELGFRLMFDQELGEEAGVRAGDGWGGDRYAQWFDGANAALLIAYRGDTVRDVEEMESALLDYARNVVPEEAFVWVEEVDGVLYFIAADEPLVGETIRASISG